ncbi:response regulator [Halocalculus aciditolerans]|uniref:Response regulatory domain-containing protein n=1 Tax=Halocalculus aciditolerans TaxID=1383812 RepID=A0A830F3S3_9EURY|nr:response regulator [Halocalculus aciditolerans]GGL59780.1 hypothetical protein GCM10009039_17490 [Halocalculus aciditolerans]
MEPEGITVLHIDDDEEFLDLTRTVLVRDFSSIDIVTATSAEDGLALLDEHEIDCVVADYRMPGMDGIELLKRVRENHESLPVVFFTGYGSEELAAEAIHSGVTDYVRKEPTSNRFALLGNRIITLVKSYRADRALEEATARELEVYERINAGFIGLDEAFHVTYLNEYAEDLFGVDATDAMDELLWDVVPDVVGTPFERELRETTDSGEDSGLEFYFAPLDAWFDLYIYRDDAGTSVYVEDVTEEVTTRNELEDLREDLELTEAEFRTLQEKLSRPPSPFR